MQTETQTQGEALIEAAGMDWDEHAGWNERGDFRKTALLDYIPPEISAAAPFLDSGGAGLAVIEVTRTRRYSKKYHQNHGPSVATTLYLIGRNEAGTYFSHPVHRTCRTVADAIRWIWRGKQDRIIARQGDIAIAKQNRRRDSIVPGFDQYVYLPSGHRYDSVDRTIRHETHEPVTVPLYWHEVIIGRRAMSAATTPSRD